MEDKRFMKHMNWYYEMHDRKEDKCCCKDHKDRHDDDKCCRKDDKCRHHEDKCCRKDDKKRHEDKCCRKDDKKWDKDDKRHDKFDDKCKGCVCNLLRKFDPGTTVDIFLTGGVSFLGVTFIALDPRNCCAYFLEAAGTAPLVVDCQKIDAIRRVS